jgi:antibiotic biosynthesis monooxygenase (ABM) superfamily enzyme
VQEDFVAVLRFDSETNLRNWLESPQRRQLLDEAAPLTAEFHTRIAQSGFEQWFRDATPEGAPAPAAWKMNMIVLLTLYPVVFLWGLLVGTPILTRALNLNFPAHCSLATRSASSLPRIWCRGPPTGSAGG